MEYIEFSLGHYPSSEGFLKLLASLFAVGGCPSDLGKNWRVRSGCSPYIEYVIDYLLPRAKGTFANLPALPFQVVRGSESPCFSCVDPLSRPYCIGTCSCHAWRLLTKLPRIDSQLFSIKRHKTMHSVSWVNTQLANEVALAPHVADAMLFMEDFQQKHSVLSNEKWRPRQRPTIMLLRRQASRGHPSLVQNLLVTLFLLRCCLVFRCSLFTSLVSILVDRTKRFRC